MSGDKPLKILVIGCGSIGCRHIRLLREMGVEVDGCDPSPEVRDRVRTEKLLTHWIWENAESALKHKRYAGAIIATPNHLHVDPAVAALSAGCGVLVEKPIAHISKDALRIVHSMSGAETGEGEASTILVGYSLRFHPGLQRVKELLSQGAIGTVRHASLHFGSYLPAWRPGVDYRTNYAASREQGGGILMDASHELDYACWLFGPPVSVMAQVQNTGALEIETEDVADLVIRFESGVQVNIHLDYLSRPYNRGCLITGDRGSINWALDTSKSQSLLYTHIDGESKWDGQPFVPDAMYRAELRHFLACLRGEEQPLVTGEDGVRAVRLVEAAQRSSEEGRVVMLDA